MKAHLKADRYESHYPALAKMLRDDILESLTYMDYTIEHWARIRTTNVVRIFPNTAAALRLIASICMEQNEEWVTGKKYLNMEYLKF